MENFIVSARKYRPQTFDTLVGQAHITTTLKNAIKNKQIAHAFLFCGPRGVGKTTCARILAKTINCENQTADGEACQTCQNCLSFQEGASLNYFELDAASNNSVDNIRELVEQIRFVPQAGKYKVYVIDEVHMLSTAAFNAFLKTLEEPPPYAIFILATTEKHKILPTILSRCQIFDFKRITIADTVDHLQQICEKEKVSAEKASLQLIAQKSEGCMRDALSIFDKIVSFTGGRLTYTNTLEHLNILDEDYFFRMLDFMQNQNLPEALCLYHDIHGKGFEGDQFLHDFAEFIRNLLVCKDEKTVSLLEVVEHFKARYLETARKLHPAYLISALNILNEAELNFKSARNKKLHTELTLIKLCYLKQSLELVSEAAIQVKKKLSEALVAFRTAPIPRFIPADTQTSAPKKRTEDNAPSSATESLKLWIVTTEPSGLDKNKKTTGERISAPTSHNEIKNTAENTRLTTLEKLRRQFQEEHTAKNEQTDVTLQSEKLHKAWHAYVEKLIEQKNPAVTSFQMAELKMTGENSFQIVAANSIEKEFIEQERNTLFSFLQKELNIKSLQFFITINENNGSGEKPVSGNHLSAKEQFQRMTALYPKIKELKDRLQLDLDY
ncbi:MAG: DNA polymerase III subunit gamma/tau [Chitinophagaceae bacterium]|nr:DNA polymerase III subunit gamma/tau [Chitinophagaceae bacterium]